MAKDFLFTSESVTEGHPDKMCDYISDSVLDAFLEKDRDSHVACETLVSTGLVLVAGEITSQANVDIPSVARKAVQNIGYNNPDIGFDYRSCSVILSVNKQSADIAQGVHSHENAHKEQGAGDQGLMFGYATNEAPEFMPMPIYCAHQLSAALAKKRKNNSLPYLRPDGKTQVTVEYQNNIPKRIHTVVISTQHAPEAEQNTIRKDMIALAHEILPAYLLDNRTLFHVNPTGRFVVGGPSGDCGLTGRKIIVDTYGGMGRHGGGAFSGKDPSKVDRSAAYSARYLAKNIVAAGLASECEIQLAYAIGYFQPVSININTFGTSKVDEKKLADAIASKFPLTPKWIIDSLDLKRPIYSKTSSYGHFGRNLPEFSWESLNLVSDLKALKL